MNKLNINLENSKNISQLNNEEIRSLQTALSHLGYKIKVDGFYGNETKGVFNQFKKDHQLTHPDLIGVTTINYINNLLKNNEKGRTKVNKRALDLIKEFEGYRSNAYLCSAGVPTIGWGSTFWEDGSRVRLGQTITPERAHSLFSIVVESFADQVAKLIKVPVTDNQFGALVSLAYNIGIGAFKNSTLLRVLNQKNYQETANQLMRWNRAGGKELAGLTRRRRAERNLFLS
jgi:lysozyme